MTAGGREVSSGPPVITCSPALGQLFSKVKLHFFYLQGVFVHTEEEYEERSVKLEDDEYLLGASSRLIRRSARLQLVSCFLACDAAAEAVVKQHIKNMKHNF